MGKTSNNQQGVKASSRQPRQQKLAAALGTPADVRRCRQRQAATRFKTFPGDGLRKVEQRVREEMIIPDAQGRISNISSNVFEKVVAQNLRHGLWISGGGKWDAAYSRGPGSAPDTLLEIKLALNLNSKTPVNIRTINTGKIIKAANGETEDNIDPQEVGRRLLEFERHKMAGNLQDILNDPRLARMENPHSELLIAYGLDNNQILITIEPYMPSAQTADQFIWLRDPAEGNFMALLPADYQQLYPDDIPALKKRRVLEWQIGDSDGNLRYLPENLPGREKLESYLIAMPEEAVPEDPYYHYRSLALAQLLEDIKLDVVQDPTSGDPRILQAKINDRKNHSAVLNKKPGIASKSKR